MDPRAQQPTTTSTDLPELERSDLEILDFERQWWKYADTKETGIRERLGLSTVGYYRRLSWIIDQPQALAHDPLLVRRLCRTRLARQRDRSVRRLG
jgi:Protein of unknown function (DUF3263)